jgi:hypothetical protein
MAQVQTFHVEAGATFAQQLVYTDDNGDLFDLDGYSAKLQLRETIESSEPALDVDLAIDIETATLSFELDPEQTSSLTAPRYKYAIELTAPTGEVTRLLQGSFKVSPEAVR